MRTSAQLRRIAALVASLGVLITPAVLLAHARLVRSVPHADETLSTSPASLQLWFSERPELRFSTLKLLDSAGVPVPIGALTKLPGDAMALSATIPVALSNGRFTVSWRTAASDGHPTSGTFSFAVAVAQPVALAGSDTDSARRPPRRVPNTVVEPAVTISPMSTAVRWADLVAVITLVGTMSFGLFVLPGARLSSDVTRDAADRARRLGNAVLVLFIVTTMWRLAAQSDLVATGPTRPVAAMMTVVRETGWGAAWLVGAIGALIVAIGLMLARTGSVGWIIAGVGAVAIAFSQGLTGHAAALRPAMFATVVDAAHVLGAGGWLGGLAAVTVCGLAATRRAERGGTDASRQLVRSFHRSAVACVAVLLGTALIAAWIRLGSVSDLWTSAYGRLVLMKIAFAAVLLAFGWFHWRTVVVPEWTDDTRFRFRRSVVFELVFGAGIVAVTAVLVTTALPGS